MLLLQVGQKNHKREQLCWCLEDKVSDFYTVLFDSNKEIAFTAVVSKMVKRFGFQEPPETTQIQFQTITQQKDESLGDWEDRVLSAATQSFRDLSEGYMTKQAVMKFCQGCNDPEAGQHACGFKQSSVENAIDKIKWFQHSRKAVQAHIAQGKTGEPLIQVKTSELTNSSETPSVHGRIETTEHAADAKPDVLTAEIRQSNRSSGASPSRDYRADNTSPRCGQGRRGDYNDRRGNQGTLQERLSSVTERQTSKQKTQPTPKSVTMNVLEETVAEGLTNWFTVVGTIETAQLLRVKEQVQDKLVTAFIDTGSEVTIMQDKVFDSLQEKPYVIWETLMHGAGRDMQMTCRIANPTLFRIDDLLFSHQLYILYIAQIDCEMLLGHDFLARNNVILNIGQGYMSINDKTIKLVLGGEKPTATPTVNRITIPTSIVI
ncbi:unnamed protein product [Mytilus coruscus]|uniref:Uncharacterized protein n=1 Tax=Mytilus coruscus TaxID=42192 RepID=A0A6J8AIQ8_MYTCO|nr:unnamed protein product [Mytilus coruscus]